MKKTVLTLAGAALLAGLALPLAASAADEDLQKKINQLSKEVELLKGQVSKVEDKSLGKWLTIGGDFRFRMDSLRGEVPDYFQFNPQDPNGYTPAKGFKPENDLLMTNRFGLNIKAKATKDVTVTTRLLMYKTTGSQTDDATNAGFFADRNSVMDGTIGHVPSDNTLRVDQAFATWSNIADQPIWFSVGRRPSTGGVPTNIRQNIEMPGNGGVPGLLVDYAFDGMTLGYAPDIDALPGAYGKICYGRGFEAGYDESAFTENNLNDTDMIGVAIIPIDTDPLRIDFQWNRGMNIFDDPNNVRANLGDIDWFGLGAISNLKKVGPGNLTMFLSTGMSITHPNDNTVSLQTPNGPMNTGAGLLYSTNPMNGTNNREDRTGHSVYAGLRYDLPSGTKLGAEYNYGSKYWMPFDPAADDMWTSKLGTRGNVYEAYVIQELNLKPISSYLSKAFFRIGYQYYDFNYTGSNNWVGAPVAIDDVGSSPLNTQMFAPLEKAQDLYATFEVKF